MVGFKSCQIGMMKIEWQGDLGPGKRDGTDAPWNQNWIRKIVKKSSKLKDLEVGERRRNG